MTKIHFSCTLLVLFAFLALSEAAKAGDCACNRGDSVGVYVVPVQYTVARPYYTLTPNVYTVARPVYGYRTFYQPYYYYPRYDMGIDYGYRGYRW